MKTSAIRTSAIVGIAVAALFGAAAQAADLQPYMKASPTPLFSWTGCYIGGNVGYGWQYNRPFDPAFPTFSVGSDFGSGVGGGGQLGCDYQLSGPWVVGIQGLFDGTGVNGSHTVPFAYSGDNTEVMSFKTTWFATLTGRVGYAVQPQSLLYVKAGAAWAHINYTDVDPTPPAFSGQANATPAGWTIGTGLEYAIQRNISLFLEYDYADFGTQNVNLTYACAGGCAFANPYLYQETHRLQTVLVGMNYRFGLGR
jgi:outer membrane immunogenic protein